MNEKIFYLGAVFTIIQTIYDVIKYKDDEFEIDIINPLRQAFAEIQKPELYTGIVTSIWVIVGWFSGQSLFFFGLTFLTGIRLVDAFSEGTKASFIFNRSVFVLILLTMIYLQYSGIYTI